MDVQMPDGEIIQGVPEGTTKAQLQHKIDLRNAVRDATAESRAFPGFVRGMGRSVGQGLISGPVSGLAGIAGAVAGSMGGPASAMNTAADWQKGTADYLGYQPQSQAELFGAAANPLSAVATPLAAAGDRAGGKVAEGTGSPLLGAAANTLTQMAPALLTPARGPVPARPALSFDAAQGAKTWEAGQKAGFTLPAGQTLEPGGQPLGTTFQRAAEYVGGKAMNEKESSLLNQRAVQQVAAKEANVPEGVNLNVDTLNGAKDAAKIPYKNLGVLDEAVKLNDPTYLSDLAKLTPESSGPLSLTTEPKVLELQQKLMPNTPEQATSSIDAALAKVNELRDDAAHNFRTSTAESVRLAKAQRSAADSLDNLVGRTVQKAVDEAASRATMFTKILNDAELTPEQMVQIHAGAQEAIAHANKLAGMMTDYKAARVLLSKIHVVEDAMNQGSGLVSGAKIKAARESGAKLTGGLQVIADMNAAFPKATQPVEAFGSGTSMDLYDILSLEHGVSGALKGNTNNAWQLGVPWLRKKARSFGKVGATPTIQPLSTLPPAVGAGADTADQLRRIAGQ